jgi:hypothetical protein
MGRFELKNIFNTLRYSSPQFQHMRSFFRLILAGGLLACGSLAYGQTFVQGQFIEVGLNPCGAFGTEAPVPPGFNNNDPFNGLGVVADIDQDGWDVGSPNDYCGDYFLPGSAVEGFVLEADGSLWSSGNGASIGSGGFGICGSDAFGTGGFSGQTSGGATLRRWKGSNAEGWDVTQETVVIFNRLVLLNRVTLCNNSGTDASSVFYQRHADPDPGQPWGVGFLTNNRVKNPGFGAGSGTIATTQFNSVFGSTDVVDCYVGLLSGDARARGSYGGFSFGVPSDAYNGIAPYSNTGNLTADQAIQLTFDLGSVDNGDCECMAWAYVFNRADAVQSWSATRVACNALDDFARTGDGEALAETLFGENATEADRAFAWQTLPQGFRMTDLASGERYQVFNRAGQLVHQGIASGVQVDVQGLGSGLYVVQVLDAQGRSRSGKVLVH